MDNLSFIIEVQFRQNATWQGHIRWVDQDKSKRFRSCLDLMKLIEEAIQVSKEKPGEDE